MKRFNPAIFLKSLKLNGLPRDFPIKCKKIFTTLPEERQLRFPEKEVTKTIFLTTEVSGVPKHCLLQRSSFDVEVFRLLRVWYGTRK